MEDSAHKNRNIFKYIVYVLLAAGVFVIVRYYLTPKPVDPESEKNIAMFMEKAIFDTDQKLKSDATKEDIASWVIWHKSSAEFYNDAKKDKNPAIKEQSKILKDHLVQVQVRDFPILREAYAISKKDVLAKENITIASSGAAKDTLTLTGSFFEPSSNKKQFMKGIDQIVKDLRFKRVVFKWSEKPGDVEDFKIKSLKDSEI